MINGRDVTFRDRGICRNVYNPLKLHSVGDKMRIGKHELTILKLLYINGEMSWNEIKETISGKSNLACYRMAYETYDRLNVIHKSLVRSMRTLQEKGLITNSAKKRFKYVNLTEKGKIAYIKRMDEN